jgi:Tfp pilus assembly protein PilX
MKRQQGISLIVVLIGLIIISFAAISLLRSTDTATLIAGNLAFKKAALASGDAGTEAAITWLQSKSGTALESDAAAKGYYATSRDACDITGSRTSSDTSDDVDWTSAGPAANCNAAGFAAAPAGVAAGYSVSYMINRMCNSEGDPNAALAPGGGAMICSRADNSGGSGASTQVGPSYSRRPFSGGSQVYYRITTRVAGPRNTVRYVQAFVVL